MFFDYFDIKTTVIKLTNISSSRQCVFRKIAFKNMSPENMNFKL